MPSLTLDINLPPDRVLALYQGKANRVLLTSRDGRRVNLPAHHLRPFMTREGVKGAFLLEFAADGALISLRRLA